MNFRLTIAVFFMMVGLMAEAVGQDQKGVAVDQLVADMGRIVKGRPAFHTFTLTNVGLETMQIDDVVTTCGCTTPEWARKPVRPGEKTEIKVGYSAATEGSFRKSITVRYNRDQTKTVEITGVVWSAVDPVAPKNRSVSLLKNIN